MRVIEEKTHLFPIRLISKEQHYKYCWRLADITIFDDVSICSFSRYLVAGRYLQKDMIAYQNHIKPIILSFPRRLESSFFEGLLDTGLHRYED